MKLLSIVISSFVLLPLTAAAFSPARTSGATIHLPLRTRVQPFHGNSPWVEAHFDETIVNSKTAIVITDMWDKHWCDGETKQVALIAQRMEPLLEKARSAGILIIHAPSDTMDFYAKAPGRLLAENAPHVAPPPEIKFQDAPLPIDDSDGGCTTPGDKPYQAWTREISTLSIHPGDIISDKGSEIYNVLKQHHIDTVLFVGAAANMCVLNRTFGIRQLSKWGLRCVLVRDLTDTMYDSASRPYVSHAAGTELVVEFIEKYWAPTVTSNELLTALKSGSPSSPRKLQ